MIPGLGYVFQKGGKFPVKRAKDLLSGNVSRTSDAFSNPNAEKEKHDEHVKITKIVKGVLNEIESEVNVDVEDEMNGSPEVNLFTLADSVVKNVEIDVETSIRVSTAEDKRENVENVINVDDLESDDLIVKCGIPSSATRLKSRKRKSMNIDITSAKGTKKPAAVGPPKA